MNEIDELAQNYKCNRAGDYFNPLETDFRLNYVCISTEIPSQRTCCLLIIKSKGLIKYGEIFGMYCENRVNHLNVLCAKMQNFLMLQNLLRIFAFGL